MSTAEKKQEVGVTISRTVGSNGHALLRFTGPFRPFQMGYTKLKMIVEHRTDVCQFLADVERERSEKSVAEEARKVAAAKAEEDPTTQAIITALKEGTISRADLLAALREAGASELQVGLEALHPWDRDLRVLPTPPHEAPIIRWFSSPAAGSARTSILECQPPSPATGFRYRCYY